MYINVNVIMVILVKGVKMSLIIVKMVFVKIMEYVLIWWVIFYVCVWLGIKETNVNFK